MNGLLLNVICAFTIANTNPNIEKHSKLWMLFTKTMQHPTPVFYVRIIL